jgi:hypothetical protein
MISLCEVSGCLACGVFVILHTLKVNALGILEKDLKFGMNSLTFDFLCIVRMSAADSFHRVNDV